ncbi:ABC transporter transmembrane domain-containing protein [Streptomyces huiliensis]|uniref:ABC transporter transmembrane domain-containing protein n=1 Tax=Streptomyces huiliensis TaxID=2876027 RepID=UPI0027DFF94A|nr:ABC transporter transmembrane domain-containing protein [Streptomyces huiliensis]
MTAAGTRRRPGAVRTVFRLTAGHRPALVTATVLTPVGSALGLAQPLLAQRIVDASADGRLLWPLLFLAALFVAEAGTAAVGRFVLERMGEGVVRGLRHRLAGRLLRLEMREYERHRTGDLVSRVTVDTTVLREVVSQALVDLVTGAPASAGAVALTLWLDPLRLLLVALTVAAAAAVVTCVPTGIRTASERTQHAVGAIAADLERVLGALPMVRVHRAEERARIAVVDQNTHVVHGSLWDNITYAAPGASRAEVRRVVELARLAEVVDRLPGGLTGRSGSAARPCPAASGSGWRWPGPCSPAPRCCWTSRRRSSTRSTSWRWGG